MVRRGSHWRFSSVALLVLIVVAGCSHDAPLAPSLPQATTTPSIAPPFEVYSRALSGRVLDENGVPVPNATVIAFGTDGNFCCPKPTTPVRSDGNGQYQTVTTAFKPPFHYFGAEVWISADGFEDTHGWATGAGDTVQDFRLFRPLTITAGAAAHLTLDSNNSLCGIEDEFRCRPVHITGGSASSVIVDVISDDPANPVWLIVGGPASVSYPFVGQTRVSVPVASGTMSTIQVLRPWTTAPQTFVLHTTAN